MVFNYSVFLPYLFLFLSFDLFSLADGGSLTCELNVELIAPQRKSQPAEAESGESGKSTHFVVGHDKISNNS